MLAYTTADLIQDTATGSLGYMKVKMGKAAGPDGVPKLGAQ